MKATVSWEMTLGIILDASCRAAQECGRKEGNLIVRQFTQEKTTMLNAECSASVTLFYI
jgi:hypothetical protein